MTILRDAHTSTSAHVDENGDLHTFSITESELEAANAKGNAYNINTGLIALTGTGSSAVLYFKNGENTDYVINGLVVFMGIRSGTVSDYGLATVSWNPTGGDIITDATAVAYKSNSNGGSSNVLNNGSLVYKGKDGGTLRS